MALTLDRFLAEHPVNRERVEEHKERMLAEVRGMDAGDLAEAVWANAETALGSWD